MLIDGQSSLWVERQTIGAWLKIFSDILARVPAVLFKHRERSISRILVNLIGVRIAEEKIAVFHPDRPFGESKALSELKDLRVGRNDGVDCRVESHHFHVHFLRCDCDGAARYLVEFELRIPHVDIVGRRIRDRTVDAKDSKLDLLTGLDVTSDDQPVLCVPTFDDRTAALSGSARQLSIHPNFGVVVDGRGEDQSRPGWIETAN